MKQARSTQNKIYKIGNVCSFTDHALERMAKYDYSEHDVLWPLAFGEKEHSRYGIYKCRLSRCNIPEDKWEQYSHLVGMTVFLIPSSRLVITVYPDSKVRRKDGRWLKH